MIFYGFAHVMVYFGKKKQPDLDFFNLKMNSKLSHGHAQWSTQALPLFILLVAIFAMPLKQNNNNENSHKTRRKIWGGDAAKP